MVLMDYHKQKIEELEQAIQKGEHLRIQAQTKLEGLETQKKETENELKALGVNPEKAEEEIKKLEEELNRALTEIDALIPSDIINQYT